MVKTIPKKRFLSVLIKLKRNAMYAKANVFGLSHPVVVACSQELDTLLNRYQGIRAIQ
ncbi:aspartyl-phosphate phosphatase Spo0E family protein [Sporosarcina sp. E16_8]|uniref:aspartyl-phosphate phosphatase Spo0E family protein n=1 Tax=Sporosarcina sp. E16_8 TaxID=2789295 RepID=UPI001A92185E|nr:aspartyl-phosphate phosphatase Spo0E family protein [Sporosarcina sp. E16_8]MBO0588086.1 aspartyl-phosphate phosphatase Spo0E family protein [Sporosarcina sp. E16_8]